MAGGSIADEWIVTKEVNMRMIYCAFLLLTACSSHAVRCDGRLQPINLPAAGAVPVAAAGAVPGGAPSAVPGPAAAAAPAPEPRSPR
jgi:hypothetical protein